MLLILFLIIAFGLGSIPFSFIIAKQVKGIDLRHHGSGNLGATNVFRTLGSGWGSLCLFLDMAKGAAAVGLMTWLVSTWPEGQATPFHITPDLFRIFAGTAAALAHTFSPFVNFHGSIGSCRGLSIDVPGHPHRVCGQHRLGGHSALGGGFL